MRPMLIKCNTNEPPKSISALKSKTDCIQLNSNTDESRSDIMVNNITKNESNCNQLPQLLSPDEFLNQAGISNNSNEEDVDEPMTCGNVIDDAPVDLNTLDNIDLDFPLNVRSDFGAEGNILNLPTDYPNFWGYFRSKIRIYFIKVGLVKLILFDY